MNYRENEGKSEEEGAAVLSKTEERPFSVLAKSDGVALYCMTIIGQIEGHYLLPDTQKTTKYEHILPLLAAIEENSEIGGLLVILNTVGGDVEAGLAIAEMLASMEKPTASVVIGGGHSIGIPIAVSCDRSFIVPSATMTIHPVRTSGTVLGVPQAFEGLAKMQSRITRFIVEHSGISEEKLSSLTFRTDEMATDVGTILEGGEAVDCGLIDEAGGLSSAIAWLKSAAKGGDTSDEDGNKTCGAESSDQEK